MTGIESFFGSVGTLFHSLRDLPPVHPILVNFTAALVPVSVVSDILGRLTKREGLRHTGLWTLTMATVVTPLTALAGWLWAKDMGGMDHPEMQVHRWLGTCLALLLFTLTYARWRAERAGRAPGVPYLLMALLFTALLTVQGHLGGVMTFGGGGGDSDVPHSHDIADGTRAPATSHAHSHDDEGEKKVDDKDGGWKDRITIKD